MSGTRAFGWTRLRLELPDAQSAWNFAARLEALGAAGVEIRPAAAAKPVFAAEGTESTLWNRSELAGLFDQREAALAAARALRAELPRSACVVERVSERDWAAVGRDGFTPLRFGERLWIVPAWQRPPRPEAANVYIAPGLAFGTGRHPSTALCLEWLARTPVAGSSVIDFGTGSGILAVAAARLGAAPVIAIDIEAQALEAARANARRNGVALEVGLPQAFERRTADVVLANLLALPLIELAAELTARLRPGGMLILSGITDLQADVVAAAYVGLVQLVERSQTSGWTRLALRRA